MPKFIELATHKIGTAEKRTGCDGPCGRSVAERSYLSPEARGGCQEEQPHVQGAVAAWAQEGQEELLRVQGQEG